MLLLIVALTNWNVFQGALRVELATAEVAGHAIVLRPRIAHLLLRNSYCMTKTSLISAVMHCHVRLQLLRYYALDLAHISAASL